MSGMQDVATLAERYSKLSSTSQQLHRNIDRLKKEVLILNYVLIKSILKLLLLVRKM